MLEPHTLDTEPLAQKPQQGRSGRWLSRMRA